MRSVLVVGDAIADVYRECRFKKMCPDAPDAPAYVQYGDDLRAGGAANVAVNLAALVDQDVEVDLIAAMDRDLMRAVKYSSRSRVYIRSGELVPLRKERILDDGRTVVRVDNSIQVTGYSAERLEVDLRHYFSCHEPDLIVWSDYGGGSVSLAAEELLMARRTKLLVDTKRTRLGSFGSPPDRSGDHESRTLMAKLNRDEWSSCLTQDPQPERYFQYVVVTKGSEGAELRMQRGLPDGRSVTHTLSTRGLDVQQVDVCGCGDTFLAGLAASLLQTSDPYWALRFANAAAATVVTQPRTAVADLDETLRHLGKKDR